MPVTRSSRLSPKLRAGVPALAFLLVLAHVVSSPVVAQQAGTAADGPAAGPTFTKDVAPILQKNCQNCHQPGAIGPMSLATYEEVRPWARAIKQRVLAGEMPPYRYDRHVGIQQLKYDLRLSEAEMRTIALLGRQRDAAGQSRRHAAAGHVSRSQQVGVCRRAGAARSHHPHQALHAPGQGSGRVVAADRAHGADQGSVRQGDYGQAVAQRSRRGAPRQQRAGGAGPEDGAVRGRRAAHGYALGKVGEIVPPDACRTLPAQSMVRWDVHYYPIGREIKDDVVEIGVWLYPKGTRRSTSRT